MEKKGLVHNDQVRFDWFRMISASSPLSSKTRPNPLVSACHSRVGSSEKSYDRNCLLQSQTLQFGDVYHLSDSPAVHHTKIVPHIMHVVL